MEARDAYQHHLLEGLNSVLESDGHAAVNIMHGVHITMTESIMSHYRIQRLSLNVTLIVRRFSVLLLASSRNRIRRCGAATFLITRYS